MQRITISLPDSLHERFKKLADEDGPYDSKSEAVRGLIHDLEEEVQEYESELRDAHEQLRECENKLQEYEGRLQEYDEELEAVDEEYEREIDDLEEEHEQAITELRAEYEQRIDDFEDEIQYLQNQIERLQRTNLKILEQREENTDLQLYVDERREWEQASWLRDRSGNSLERTEAVYSSPSLSYNS